jgi:hypothetical protein
VIDQVYLDAPNDGTSGVEVRPTFAWESISGIISYEMQLDVTPDFTNPTIKSLAAEETSVIEYEWSGAALDSAKQYYWRVKAMHNTDETGWSEVWTFSTGVVGIDDPVLNAENVKIYPNPASKQVFLQFKTIDNTQMYISMIDLVGQEIYRDEFILNAANTTKQIPLNGLPEGIYMIRVQNEKHTYTSKLIIKK